MSLFGIVGPVKLFSRYIGIDYSGAQTPTSSLKGLRVYLADVDHEPVEVPPPPSPRKYWTRRGIAEWLAETLAGPESALVGIDHGFSFPLRYFEVHRLEPDWEVFLEDFHRHWPTDSDHVYVDFVRDGIVGDGAEQTGDRRWRRLTEERAGTAKSVFHFDVQGQVAKSTMPGFPGCAIFDNDSAIESISGRSMDGRFHLRSRSLQRSIRLCGTGKCHEGNARRISMTRT